MSTQTPETHTFQAEVQQLLDIVINSLYTDREIFIRELVSNASDALEKLRHLQITEDAVFDDNLELEVRIDADEEAGTITFQDFGLGMTREELQENLGTIAHSGSKAFLKALKESGGNNENLIGQFGVGFYSAFMVAEEVEVYSRTWRPDGTGYLWKSKGDGSYSIEEADGLRRGTKIVVKLKEDAKEFAKADRIKDILKRYSSFVQFPVKLADERVNTIEALWLKPKSEVTDEQYKEFYKFQTHGFDEPLATIHFASDAPLQINALVFIPTENIEAFGFAKMEPEVSLYCRKVLIDPKPEGLLPEWCRFAKGVVDSADLPLNISRESMQDSALIQKLGTVITKRIIRAIEDEAKKRPDNFEKIYKAHNRFIKEGVTSDFTHREALAKLLRYESSLTDEGKTTSLADYKERMKEGQEAIYYLHAPSRETIETGPYLEAFKAKGYEVLYIYEPIDEFVMTNLGTFDSTKLVAADQADIDLDDAERGATDGDELPAEEVEALCTFMKGALGETVSEVTTSKRLVGSPAVAINDDKMMTPSMRRLMKQMQQDIPTEVKVKMELNPRHGLVHNLARLRTEDPDTAKMVAQQVLDNAMIAAGFIEDPRSMVNRVYDLLERLSKK